VKRAWHCGTHTRGVILRRLWPRSLPPGTSYSSISPNTLSAPPYREGKRLPSHQDSPGIAVEQCKGIAGARQRSGRSNPAAAAVAGGGRGDLPRRPPLVCEKNEKIVSRVGPKWKRPPRLLEEAHVFRPNSVRALKRDKSSNGENFEGFHVKFPMNLQRPFDPNRTRSIRRLK
jgi:hypothetical protein